VNLSVIIPIYTNSYWNSHVGIRVSEVVDDWIPYGCEIVIVDASPKPTDRAQHLIKVDGLRYCHAPQAGVFSAGAARDIGAQHASRDFIFFFDVDLVFNSELVTKIQSALTDLEASPLSFLMVPCLYLKKDATQAVELDKQVIKDYWLAYLQGNFSGVINLAVASSAIVIHRGTYLSYGGHRHEFAGHGCEDLELINRLTLEYPLGRRLEDHYLDVRQEVIANSVGFRRHFSYYGLPRSMEGMLVAHRWHPRPIFDRYFRSRTRNDEIFKDFLVQSDLTGSSPPALPDLNVCGKTLVLVDNVIDDVQSLRQFLPDCGEYKVLRLGASFPPTNTFDRVLYVGKKGHSLVEANHINSACMTGALYPKDENPNIWRLYWRAANGVLVRDEIHEGIRRYYGDRKSYRWIFFRGEDKLSRKQLYRFEVPAYDNLKPFPPLEEFVRYLLIKSGLALESHKGFFMNQWGQLNSAEMLLRKMRKLILKPNVFFRDSRIFRRFYRNQIRRKK
jgi:predicted glycosyltransferase involved in capsule biosynthesis